MANTFTPMQLDFLETNATPLMLDASTHILATSSFHDLLANDPQSLNTLIRGRNRHNGELALVARAYIKACAALQELRVAADFDNRYAQQLQAGQGQQIVPFVPAPPGPAQPANNAVPGLVPLPGNGGPIQAAPPARQDFWPLVLGRMKDWTLKLPGVLQTLLWMPYLFRGLVSSMFFYVLAILLSRPELVISLGAQLCQLLPKYLDYASKRMFNQALTEMDSVVVSVADTIADPFQALGYQGNATASETQPPGTKSAPIFGLALCGYLASIGRAFLQHGA